MRESSNSCSLVNDAEMSMNKPTDPPIHDRAWSRSASIIFASVFAVFLLLQLLRWDRSWKRIDTVLLPTALLIISMPHVFQLKGYVRRIFEVVAWALVILGLVILALSIFVITH